MSKKCVVCGKTQRPGISLSHSHHRTKKFFKANLQPVRTLQGKVLVCTGCLKRGKVSRA